MDKLKFTNPAGKLIPITFPKKDWAFIPDDLPSEIEFPLRLWPLLAEAKEKLGKLDGIGMTLKDPSLLLMPLKKREAIASSSIEGTYVTPEQLFLYGMEPDMSHKNEMQDQKEVFNCFTAVEYGIEILKKLPFHGRVIKSMHELLFMDTLNTDKNPGNYRQGHVQIGSTARYVPPPHEYIDDLMSHLITCMNSENGFIDPLVQCFMVHYQFEAIHPFIDGNGRIGRVLLSLMIQKLLKHETLILYMSPFFEKYRDEYVKCMFEISSESRWDNWIELCLTGVIAQAHDAIIRCMKFNQLKQKYHELIQQTATVRSHQIIDELFSNPIVTVRHVKELTKVTYHTAKNDIIKLVEAGILTEGTEERSRSYTAEVIIHIAFRELEYVKDLIIN